MNIGFDAKRAYHNGTGLGHYSRTLINSLAANFPEHDYYLFNPNAKSKFALNQKSNIHEVVPQTFFSKIFSPAWRSICIKKDLLENNIALYHGLSNEIPLGIRSTGIKTVVTIHDLIFERYPEQYNSADVKIYRKKFRYACENADSIIAISNQTKNDIIAFYNIPAEKINVCYQSCNPAFAKEINNEEKYLAKEKYQLPGKYFLHVGSIISRKNLLSICMAMNILKSELNIPLVIIGDGEKYLQQVKEYISQNNLTDKIIFLSHHPKAKEQAFISSQDFPAIYQSAIAMIYPSMFEGFGIPVLEALFSKLPVITSNISSLPEAGGNAAYYIDPLKPEEIAEGMKKIFCEDELRKTMIEKGIEHAQKFTAEICAEQVMDVYKKLI